GPAARFGGREPGAGGQPAARSGARGGPDALLPLPAGEGGGEGPRLPGGAALNRVGAALLLLAPLAPPVSAENPTLNESLASVAKSVAAEFADKGLTEEGLAITAVDLTSLSTGSWRGDASHYPASVVKAFYLAYYEKLKETGKLKDTPELVRAVKDMITV